MMKIALIQASPKMKNSSSKAILNDLKQYFTNEHDIKEYHWKHAAVSKQEQEEVFGCDVLVFAFPLYVDGIPSHLLHCLVELETVFCQKQRNQKEKKEIVVYALVNCGFYEGHQNALALEMMENWCIKSGLTWGQGIGIGAGGMLLALTNVAPGHAPKKNIGIALQTVSKNIQQQKSEGNLFVAANFPRAMYQFMAEAGWRKQIKANGLKTKDLYLKR